MNIIQIFPGKIWGGAEQFILDLGQALTDKGYNIYYISRNSKAIKERTSGIVQLTTLPFKGIFDIITIKTLTKIIKSKDIDIIHIHDMKFVPIVCMAKKWSNSDVRIVVHRHIARASKTGFVTRIFLKQVNKIIFVSALARNLWSSANKWFPKYKCKVAINSIPKEDLKPGSSYLRSKFNIPQNIPLLVFTGRIRKSKGCATIIDSLAKIKDLKFHMIFIGACKPKDYASILRKKAAASGMEERISFYGFANNTRELIKEADIGVAPSIVREACPLSPMEFMQAGKPVIASDNGAQQEYITSGITGILISPDNSSELASAIKKLLENPALRKEIGASANEYFNKNLSYNKFIQQIIEYYS